MLLFMKVWWFCQRFTLEILCCSLHIIILCLYKIKVLFQRCYLQANKHDKAYFEDATCGPSCIISICLVLLYVVLMIVGQVDGESEYLLGFLYVLLLFTGLASMFIFWMTKSMNFRTWEAGGSCQLDFQRLRSKYNCVYFIIYWNDFIYCSFYVVINIAVIANRHARHFMLYHM